MLRRIGRRRFILGAATAGAGALLLRRCGGYPAIDWRGERLSATQALVVAAAAEALLPPLPGQSDLLSVARCVDRYLLALPPGVQREVDALLLLVEHGTTPLLVALRRFTRLDPAARERYLTRLDGRGGLLGQAYRGLRDLCMLGYYQQPASWRAIGYDGPSVPEEPRPVGPPYSRLLAPAGALPRSAVR